ncbi:hypothetical protein FHX74_001687 [Friedmanniella endophytica]|uniref:Uncharacterized protein n=1 Tax=Microlunatus kandeliicorticis TaxID=1759536 RepID=A0A7W3P5P5_9ACTN|nr:hypothetical protein [Microlunatus kandeliicorticis]MBA8794082.1 hypothetical protein [Microlunatus kandeliicorticis]
MSTTTVLVIVAVVVVVAVLCVVAAVRARKVSAQASQRMGLPDLGALSADQPIVPPAAEGSADESTQVRTEDVTHDHASGERGRN